MTKQVFVWRRLGDQQFRSAIQISDSERRFQEVRSASSSSKVMYGSTRTGYSAIQSFRQSDFASLAI